MSRLAVANDAHLIQLARGASGRDPSVRGLPRPNVSSRKLIATLHGVVPDSESGRALEEAVSRCRALRAWWTSLAASEG